jgi:hypothetical protein
MTTTVILDVGALVALNPYMRHLSGCTYSTSICSNPDSDFCTCRLGRAKERARNALETYRRLNSANGTELGLALDQLNPYLQHDRGCSPSTNAGPLANACRCELDQRKTAARKALDDAGI